MDYKKIAFGSFYDKKGRTWGINLFRRTDSVLAARELTFEGSEAAVVEWDEFDLEQPIQGSSLTLRIISEADREWTSLYTVNDGDVVAEVTLAGQLWWRGSLDPETYEEPYERAQDYTVELRFSDFGPLKRHQFTPPGEGGLIKTEQSIGTNLLAVGTVTELSVNGLPANIDLSSIAVPEGKAVEDLFGIGAGEDAFREDEDSGDYIKAWDALCALLTASGLRMTQRAGKIMLYNLKGLRDHAAEDAGECVWSGDHQTLGVDRIASRVTVSHSGDGESNIVRDLTTGREQDDLIKASTYTSRKYGYASFDISLFKTSTWKHPENAWGFFTLRAGLDNVASAEGWMMWAYHSNGYPFGAFIADAHYQQPLAAYPGSSPYCQGQPDAVAATPAIYIHLTDSAGVHNKPQSGYRIKIEQEMLFDCRNNPFSDEDDPFKDNQDRYEDTQFIYVMAFLSVRTDTGKTYYWTNQHRIADSSATQGNLYAACDFTSGKWSEAKEPYWIQYRTKEKAEDGQLIGGGWIRNMPFVSRPSGSMEKKKIKYNVATQKLPEGDYIPLPPERGWLTLEVCNALRCVSTALLPESALNAMRWILGKGARISIVDANANFGMPESAESEVKLICNNGAEDITDISPLLGSGGGYLGCRSLIINADGKAAEKGEPELRTATEIASQLCMRRTKLTGEAYINTQAPLTFTERLQTGRVFLLASERMDLQCGWGDRVITELVRTDIEGLEVRRNERVIFEGTSDRGGRDGRDAEAYSIIPTATAVAVKSKPAVGINGKFKIETEFIPSAVGCSVYLTVGDEMRKTRDGVLRCRITDKSGNITSDTVLETDGGEATPITVTATCASIEFRLMSDETEDAVTLARCTVPVASGTGLFPDYDSKSDKLNFVDLSGDPLIDGGIDLSKFKDITIGAGAGLTGGGTLEENRTISLMPSGIAAGTYTKVTVDIYGRVTFGESLATADIPVLSIGKISGLQAALDSKFNTSAFDAFKTGYDTWKGTVDTFMDTFNSMFVKETVGGETRIKALFGLYTDEFLTAHGVNTQAGGVGGGGTAYSRLDAWSDYAAGKEGHVLSAKLGYDLYQNKLDAITKAMVESVLTGNITTHTHPQYLTSHQDISGKVDNVAGKGLSANDLTDTLLAKLNGIEEGANKYVHPAGGADQTIAAANGRVVSAITVNSLGHVTSVASKTLAAADIPSLDWGKITTGKPTTLSGYGIADAYTKSEADGKYVTLATEQTITGKKTFNNTTTFNSMVYVDGLLSVGGSGQPCIELSGSDEYSYGCIVAGEDYLSISNARSHQALSLMDDGMLTYGVNEVLHEGNYASKLDTRYVKKSGDTMSGLLTLNAGAKVKAGQTLQIGDCVISWDAANGGLKFSKGIYSEGFVSAKGANASGSASGGLVQTVYGSKDLGKTFADTTLTDTFNAFTIKGIADRVTSLEGGSALSVTTTGTGNAITAISKSGTAITATKGSTFALSSHTHSNFLPLTGGSISSPQWNPLDVNGTNNMPEAEISFAHQGNLRGSVGFNNVDFEAGIALFNYANGAYCLGVKDDGTPHYNEFELWHSGNDGTGSGLDADLLDGKHASAFVTLATEQTITGKKTFDDDLYVNGDIYALDYIHADGGAIFFGDMMIDQMLDDIEIYNGKGGDLCYNGEIFANDSKVWHSGNDGSGSGLNADLLDGNHASAFLGASANAVSASKLADNTTFKAWGQTFFTNGKPATANGRWELNGVSSGTLSIFDGTTYRAIQTYGSVPLCINPVGNEVCIGTTVAVSNSVHCRKHFVMGNASLYFIENANGQGDGVMFGPGSDSTGTYLAVMGHSSFTYKNTIAKFYYNGGLWAKTGVYSDGYVSARGQNTSSDARLKEGLTPFEIELSKIAFAPNVEFLWKDNGQRDLGSIAQYWRDIHPSLTPEDNRGFLTLQYGKTALLASISIAKKVLSHEVRIKALEKENMELKRKIEILERR